MGFARYLLAVLLMAFEAANGTITLTTGAIGTTFTVSGLSFQPKAIIFTWSGRATTGQAEADHMLGAGYAVSTTSRRAVATQSDHTSSTMAADHGLWNDACVVTLTITRAIGGKADLDAITSDGFRLIVDDQFPADLQVAWLALGGSDLTNAEIQTFADPGGTGDTDITSFGFQPDAVIFLNSGDAAVNGTGSWSNFNIGVAAGATPVNATLAGASQDAVGTSITGSYARTGDAIAGIDFSSATSTALYKRASVTAWLSNGFTLNYATDLVTFQNFALALKGGQYQVGDALTSTGTSNQTEGTDFTPKALMILSSGKAAHAAGVHGPPDERIIGFATDAASQRSVGSIDKDAAAVADIGTVYDETDMYVNQSIDATIIVEGEMRLVSFDATPGFTYVMSDADPVAAYFGYLAFGDNPGGAAYTLAVDSGSYALTGTVSGVKMGRNLPAAAGSYTETGTAAGLRAGRKIGVGSGTYNETGTAATLPRTYAVGAVSGSYTFTGTAAGVGFGYRVGGGVGSYSLTGTDASLEYGRKVGVGAGSYTFTGTDVSLKSLRVVSSASGAYVFTGTDADLDADRRISATSGSYALTGTAANLVYAGTQASISAESGTFTFTGTAAGLQTGRKVSASAGSYVLTGTAVGLKAGRSVTATSGSYTFTGDAATLTYAQSAVSVLSAESGAYSVTGGAAVLTYTSGWSGWPYVLPGGAASAWPVTTPGAVATSWPGIAASSPSAPSWPAVASTTPTPSWPVTTSTTVTPSWPVVS